jgi:hypothetical protein
MTGGAEQTFGVYGRELLSRILDLVDGSRKCLLPWVSWNGNMRPIQQYLWSRGEIDIVPDQNRILSSGSVMKHRHDEPKSLPHGCDSSRVAACDCGAIYWHLQHDMSMRNVKAMFEHSRLNTTILKPKPMMRPLVPLPGTCFKNICPAATLRIANNASLWERWWDCPAYSLDRLGHRAVSVP